MCVCVCLSTSRVNPPAPQHCGRQLAAGNIYVYLCVCVYTRTTVRSSRLPEG